ncbi:hypothetical protein HAX54_035500 [Datura stramonium]|uniref:Uncharacterized protein n=1 Tax=Datura stramonium TaxID=4076 RepID=A0ABS8VI30_DATST|nr:hypothetical protein [Datura stramonium]
MDDDIFEWEMEEEVVGELIADVFLNGEELEEVKRKRRIPRTAQMGPPDLVRSEGFKASRQTMRLSTASTRVSAIGGPSVDVRESPVVSQIDLPNIACWHHYQMSGFPAVQSARFTGGANTYDVLPSPLPRIGNSSALRECTHQRFAMIRRCLPRRLNC